jgi:hypothetical protein
MNREEALGLLNAKLDKYRNMSYAELSAKIGDEEFPEVVGPSATDYQIRPIPYRGNRRTRRPLPKGSDTVQ